MDNNAKSQLFKRAWARARKTARSFSEALRSVWAEYRAETLRAADGVSKDFEAAYLKADGTLRIARGTFDLSKVPADQQPKGVRNPSEAVITYFDLDRNGWRSIRRERLISLKTV